MQMSRLQPVWGGAAAANPWRLWKCFSVFPMLRVLGKDGFRGKHGLGVGEGREVGRGGQTSGVVAVPGHVPPGWGMGPRCAERREA